MSALPRGWLSAPLADIADTSLGKMLDRGKSSGHPEVPYLRNVNVQWGRIDVSDVLTMEMPPEQQEFFRLRTGDLLVCEGGEIGRCAVWPGGSSFMTFQKALHRIRPSKAVDARFLRYQLEHMSKTGGLASFATGSTIKHLPQQQLRQLPMLVPPLAEQRRIVEALEDHLSRLDAAQGQMGAALLRCRVLRDAAVAELVQGRVGWERHAIGSLLREPLRNGHSAPASAEGFGVRTLTITAVTVGNFSDANTKVTSADPARVRDLWLEPGDILVQRSNTPELVGTTAMYDGPRNWAIFPDLLIRLRPCDRLLPEFLTAVLRSSPVRRHFRSKAKGLAGSMPKIDQPTIMSTMIPVPSISEQRRALEAYRRWNERIDRLRTALEVAERRAVRLRASLLRQAFSGRLVPQDPSDEPASALLDRIRAERAAVSKPVRHRYAHGVTLQREP